MSSPSGKPSTASTEDGNELRAVQKELEDIRYALDAASIVAITDAAGTIIHANDKFCEISGYSREFLLGKTHQVVNSGHHSKEFFRELWSTIQAGRVWRGEVKNQARDGSFYWVETTIVPFLDATGEPYQYLSIRNEITARKQAEQALDETHRRNLDQESRERAHQRLQHLYEISTLFADFDNVEQTLDAAVGVVARTLPLRSAILVDTGRSRTIVWPSEGQLPEQLQPVKDHLKAAYGYLVGAASVESLELREQAGMTPLPRCAGTDVDFAKRSIVLPLVVARRPLFGALLLEGDQPLDKLDLMFVNAVAIQLAIALDRDRAWQRDIRRREHAEEGRTDAEARGATSEQARVLAEEGRTDAEATGAVAERGRIIAEISSEKFEALAAENARLYEEARHAVRAREQLLAIVSHDLRTPLGTIVMASDVLAERGDLPVAGRIQRAAKSMARLIEDLLDFAAIESGRLTMRRQPHDPGSMIQETLASFEGVAQAKGLQLTAKVEPDLPQVHGDADRILQVLSNLVGNATKAAAEGGHIHLRAEARGHEVLFAVSDNGPGISAQDLAHLFERYWRSDDAAYKGTGLGLAIASGIISAHGGRIWAESELGRGATFLFTIPTADVTSLFTVPTPDPRA